MVNNMADRSPERARQDYVKVIYQLGQRAPVKAAQLARYLGVSRASVSKFKRMLERERLLHPSQRSTDALRLTKKGEVLALRMVRRHRLVETFLHDTLRMPIERVHGEAERIEHAISDEVSSRLARFLHNPVADPHGHRIPGTSHTQSGERDRSLASLNVGDRVTITSIDDRDPEAVRRLCARGILPGLRATLERVRGAVMHLRAGRRALTLSAEDVAGVRCQVHASERKRP
jgi:DtxR family Mn-dependent transcriptional regulator